MHVFNWLKQKKSLFTSFLVMALLLGVYQNCGKENDRGSTKESTTHTDPLLDGTQLNVFSEWSDWSGCISNLRYRYRYCLNEDLTLGGCAGSTMETMSCATGAVPTNLGNVGQTGNTPVDDENGIVTEPGDGWSDWSLWSDCSHSCGSQGTQNRTRSCQISSCTGPSTEIRQCNIRSCLANPGVQAKELAVGKDHVCAFNDAGQVFCWGDNSKGQLGIGVFAPQLSKVQVNFGSKPVAAKSIAAGDHHTCVIDQDNELWCWGDNSQGQLGTGNQITSSVPQAIMSLETSQALISLGVDYSCVADRYSSANSQNEDSLWCWGSNASKIIEYRNEDDFYTEPERIYSFPVRPASQSRLLSLAAGESHVCLARSVDGGHVDLVCRGNNQHYKMAFAKKDRIVDRKVTSHRWTFSGTPFIGSFPYLKAEIAMSSTSTCVLLQNMLPGKATQGYICSGKLGQNGSGVIAQSQHGSFVSSLTSNKLVESVQAGEGHHCLKLKTKKVTCRGSNTSGQIGTFSGSQSYHSDFVDLATMNSFLEDLPVKKLKVGNNTSCAILDYTLGSEGHVRCWGAAAY